MHHHHHYTSSLTLFLQPMYVCNPCMICLFVGETHNFKGDNIDIWCEAIQERFNWAQKKTTTMVMSGSSGGHKIGMGELIY